MQQPVSGTGPLSIRIPVRVVQRPSLPEIPTQTPALVSIPRSGRQAVTLPFTPLPLQFPSLEHLDRRVAECLVHAQAVNGLTDATCAWIRKSYASFRRYLKATQSEGAFLGGDIRMQVRIAEGWIA